MPCATSLSLTWCFPGNAKDPSIRLPAGAANLGGRVEAPASFRRSHTMSQISPSEPGPEQPVPQDPTLLPPETTGVAPAWAPAPPPPVAGARSLWGQIAAYAVLIAIV